MSEAVGGVGGCDGVEGALHGLPQRILCAQGQRAKPLLDLGEDHLDRVEVRRIRRQEHQLRPARLDQLTHPRALVARQVVHDHHIARLQLRHQHLPDERPEYVGVHRAVHRRRAPHAADAEGRDERRGLPVPVRRLVHQPLAAFAAAAQPRHVGLGPRLVDEDQPRDVERRLICTPVFATLGDVRPVLLARVERLFL